MNSCTLGALTAVLVTGLVMSNMLPSTTPNDELIKANAELQAKLMQLSEQSEKAYQAAKQELETAKKNLTCPK